MDDPRILARKRCRCHILVKVISANKFKIRVLVHIIDAVHLFPRRRQFLLAASSTSGIQIRLLFGFNRICVQVRMFESIHVNICLDSVGGLSLLEKFLYPSYSWQLYTGLEISLCCCPVTEARLYNVVSFYSSWKALETPKMQNEEGQITELYIPRKW